MRRIPTSPMSTDFKTHMAQSRATEKSMLVDPKKTARIAFSGVAILSHVRVAPKQSMSIEMDITL
jgi:hypothetical protein